MLYKITEFNKDTVQSYRIDNLNDRYKEVILGKTELTLKENEDFLKCLNLN